MFHVAIIFVWSVYLVKNDADSRGQLLKPAVKIITSFYVMVACRSAKFGKAITQKILFTV